jgi:hypothetical protein
VHHHHPYHHLKYRYLQDGHYHNYHYYYNYYNYHGDQHFDE